MTTSELLPDLNAFWDFDHPEKTENRFQELLTETSQSHPSFHIELLTQIARAKGLQNQLGEAEQVLKEAEKLLESTHPTSPLARIRFLLEKARIHILRKTPSQARPLLIEAGTLANQSRDDFYFIDAAQLLAAIEPPKQQQEWIQKALTLAESSQQLQAQLCLGKLYTIRGWAQYDARQFENALDTFKKALSCIKAEGIPRKTIVAKWAIAKVLRTLHRSVEALEIQKDLLAEANQLNQKDGYIYEELAECLQSLKRSDEAQIYFDLAYRELSKDDWLSDNKPDRIKRLKNLGKSK